MRPGNLDYEPRRRKDLAREMEARAHAWLSEWRAQEGSGDVAKAVLEIAARLESEVAQRLDRMPEKTFRGFLSWLGVRGAPGRAARLPVALKLAAGAEPVLLQPPAKLQAAVGDQSITFETKEPLRVAPGAIAAVVGAQPASDVFSVGPVSPYAAPEPLPDTWRILTQRYDNATVLQLDPPVGLDAGVVLTDVNDLSYRVVEAKEGLITIEPALGTPRRAGDAVQDPWAAGVLKRRAAFAPFAERSAQSHAVYLGSANGLDITFPARIGVPGAEALAGARWSYWGQAAKATDPDWLDLTVDADAADFVLKSDGKGDKFAPTKVNGVQARWLRARPPAGDGPPTPQELVRPRFTVNCGLNDPGQTNLVMEGIANTAPLVLDQPFYPLGREPRIFDAFYFSCDEAFSKPNADVTITFGIGGDYIAPLMAIVAGRTAIAAAIGADNKFYAITTPLAAAVAALAGDPPPPTFGAGEQATDSEGRPVPFTAGLRPAGIAFGEIPIFAAAAGATVRVRFGAAWSSLGKPSGEDTAVDDVAFARDANGRDLTLFATSGGALYRRGSVGLWQETPRPAGVTAHLKRIAPIVRAGAEPGDVREGDGLLVVSDDGQLFRVTDGVFEALRDNVDPDVYPLGLLVEADTADARVHVFVKTKDGAAIEASRIGGADEPPKRQDLALVGRAFGHAMWTEKHAAAIFVFEQAGANALATWAPFAIGGGVLVKDTPSPDLAGPPVRFVATMLVPLEARAVALGDIDPKLIANNPAHTFTTVAVLDSTSDWDAPHKPLFLQVRDKVFAAQDERAASQALLLALPATAPTPAEPEPVTGYRESKTQVTCDLIDAETLAEQTEGDLSAYQAGDVVIVTWGGAALLTRIAAVNPATATDPASVTLDPALPVDGAALPATVEMRGVTKLASQPKALLRPGLDFADPPPRLAAVLQQPLTQMQALLDTETYSVTEITGHLIVLAAPLKDQVDNDTRVVVAAPFAARRVFEPDRPSNPALSWEYWDGSSWWRIPTVEDHTADLLKTGDVRFCAPPGLQPTDVVGRNKHWIRARLVGGDYGQEEITVDPDTHKVTRDASKILAPYVTSVSVSYKVCCPMVPDQVLTQDNGGFRDQTAAARAERGTVQAFTPLKDALAAPKADAAPSSAAGAPAESPALYLGFSKPLDDAGVSLLFLLDDDAGSQGAFPLQAEGFADGAFVPLGCDDRTRGLSETGLVVLSFPAALQEAALFGQTLFWVRLKPNLKSDFSKWSPHIRAAYLNGAFVTAAETQTEELLGSSDGSTSQKFKLARPPVVSDSLVLRVREPLGEEDVAALRDTGGAEAVRDAIGPRPGPWVRWTRGNLAAAGPTDRVYELDAATGEIAFGDSRRGLIPPMARDSILAQSYQAGGGAAANQAAAWTQLGLITPVKGVEAVVAPEGAAGGADPEDAAAVLRLAPGDLAMRNRAMTVRDFERLALGASGRVCQARAFTTAGGVRVVAVARGEPPTPSQADIRELTNALLEKSSPAFARKGALIVTGPRLVELQITVAAVAPDLSQGAAVADAVRRRVKALLDPAVGGYDGAGWPLGEAPSGMDIAGRLDGVAGLESFEITVSPARALARDELAHLNREALRVTVAASLEVVG
jgi:hypothetical protein